MLPIAIFKSVDRPTLEARDSINIWTRSSVSQPQITLYWFNLPVLAFSETWRLEKGFYWLVFTTVPNTGLTINTTAIIINTIDTRHPRKRKMIAIVIATICSRCSF